MDHSAAPVLEALRDYRGSGEIPFTPPGHKQGRGADPRVLAVLGESVFHSDVPATEGLDDRRSSHGVLRKAQELMADAVRAEHAFFSTCGSSLSVKSAMLSVAGPHEKLVVGRDAHKIDVPGPDELGLEQVKLPRDAFFGPTEQVPVGKAAGRIAAEMLTPYPPGIPAALPGERLTSGILDYLTSGIAHAMVVPDAVDPELGSVRVVIEK